MKAVGIDLAGLEKNDTGFCALDDKNNAEVCILHTDIEIINAVQKENPDIACIDGPLSKPAAGIMRKCDAELRRYGALPPMLMGMKALTERATKLRSALENLGFKVIEVFPNATANILGYYDRDWRNIQGKMATLKIFFKRNLTKDEIDAVSAAITGILFLRGQTKNIGDKGGVIVVPAV